MSATGAAERFLNAIFEADTDLIWDLFSAAAREHVVARGMRRGLSADLGRALLEGTAEDMERAEFMGDLLGGLQRDLETVDLSRVHVEPIGESFDASQETVVFYERFIVAVGPPLEPLPVGSIELVRVDGKWMVDRLVPGPPKPI